MYTYLFVYATVIIFRNIRLHLGWAAMYRIQQTRPSFILQSQGHARAVVKKHTNNQPGAPRQQGCEMKTSKLERQDGWCSYGAKTDRSLKHEAFTFFCCKTGGFDAGSQNQGNGKEGFQTRPLRNHWGLLLRRKMY